MLRQVHLRGAGFQDAQTKQCKFVGQDGSLVDAVDIEDQVGNEFYCTANLPSGKQY